MANCTKDQIDQGTAKAKKVNDSLPVHVKYACVDVTIEEVTANTIVLTTSGEDNIKRRYLVPISQVWNECPSVARAAGEVGKLLISKQGLEARSNDVEGIRIYGSTPDQAGNTKLLIKWPDSGGPGPDVKPLKIWPTSIVVKGYAINDPHFHSGSVNLLDAEFAGFEQNIQLSRGTEIVLSLTPKGRGAFQMSGVNIADLKRYVELVKTPYKHDAQERAEAWGAIERARRFSDWEKAQTDLHSDSNEIDLVLAKLTTA